MAAPHALRYLNSLLCGCLSLPLAGQSRRPGLRRVFVAAGNKVLADREILHHRLALFWEKYCNIGLTFTVGETKCGMNLLVFGGTGRGPRGNFRSIQWVMSRFRGCFLLTSMFTSGN